MERRHSYPVLGVALVATLVSPVTPASADPEGRHKPPVQREFGNGPERNTLAASTLGRDRGADHTRFPWARNRGYPRQQELPLPPENPADASIKLGLTPYHSIAPKLNELQRISDRISVEVIARSHQGRDLYLVTVTEPESSAAAALQARMRSEIQDDAARAARDPLIKRSYKAPVFINNNIHGNEWEGTDAALRTIEKLATAQDASTKELLGQSRLYFNITANPDGRVANTRANGAGFDMNRDFITGSQPEVRGMRQVMIDTQPVAMLDLHGYVNGTLIEPTTPPHGQNYEYDLFIKNAYPNGLGMEAAVKALGYTPEPVKDGGDGVQPPQIPFRDWTEGWDDWPPIFTPQYAPFHGAVASHTIEIPLRVNNTEYRVQPAAELQRRSRINVNVAAAAMTSTLSFVEQRRESLLADQIEVFRRGAAGEPSRATPIGTVPGFGPEDVYTTNYPRAYVIPTGGGQRSETAAARLVDHLIANDVRVERATKAFTLNGRGYAAGSYVVDMHQPKRGIANVILEPGADISSKVDAMYDISGWSLAHLWGATVDTADSGDLRPVSAKPVSVAAPTGSVAPSGDLSLRLDDGKDVTALNALLADGVTAKWAADGSVVIPDSARSAAQKMADRYGVRFTRATAQGTAPLRKLTIAAAGSSDDLYSLQEMGFTVKTVSTATLNAGFDWAGVDVLYVSSGLNYAALEEPARTTLNGFLAKGGVVTRGATGAAFNTAAGLLTATPVAGRGDANGTVAVTNAGGPITSGAPNYSFVYSPRWFTGLGPEVTVEQRYAAQGPLIAGHWRANSDGTGGGPEAAVGQPTIVRGVDERGAAVVLFGTEPLFRNHPKGLFAEVARSLHWTAVTAGARQTTR